MPIKSYPYPNRLLSTMKNRGYAGTKNKMSV